MPQFDTPINTNDQSLDRVLANPLPVLLVLNGDSSLQNPLNELARSEAGKLLVVKLNTSENPNTAKKFKVSGESALIIWKNKAEQLRLQFPTAEQIQQAADFTLGRGPAPQTAPRAEPSNSTNGKGDDHPFIVTEATFEQEVLKSSQPVLVDFWAAWCGPCRMVAPTLDKLSREFAGKVRIAKLNVDENPRLAATYKAHSIPLLILFKDGKPFNQLLGAHPEPNIRSLLNQALAAPR